MSLSAMLTRRPRVGDAVEDLLVLGRDRLRLGLREDVLAEQRRVRVEPALVEPRKHRRRLLERLAGDEPVGAQPHAVLARDAADPPAARGREDALPQRAVDALRDHVGGPARGPGAHAGTASSSPRTARSSSPRSSASRMRSGARTSTPMGTPRSAHTTLSAAGIGKRSSVTRASPGALGRLGRPLAHGRHHQLGERRRECRDRTDRAARERLGDQRLGSAEDVQAIEQVRLEALPRLFRDLQAGEVRDALAELLDHGQRDRDSRCGR